MISLSATSRPIIHLPKSMCRRSSSKCSSTAQSSHKDLCHKNNLPAIVTVSLAWDQSERDYMGIRTGAKLHYVLWEIQAWSAPTHSPYGFILIDNSSTKDLWGDNRLKEDYSSLNGFHGKIRPSWHELYWIINILLDDNSLIWHGDIFKHVTILVSSFYGQYLSFSFY